MVGPDTVAGLTKEGIVTDVEQAKPYGVNVAPRLAGKVLVYGGTVTNKFQNAIRANGRKKGEAALYAFKNGKVDV